MQPQLAKLLEEFLEWGVHQTRELVINGDIFDGLNFTRLTKRHFACLKIIRRNSDRDDFRLVWVRGNHDGPADIISHIVGVEINGRAMSPKERAVHGAFAALGAVLEFGPAAMSAVQTSRALSQIQKASGVTRSEAQALLNEARAMSAEERALLKLAAEGKPVDASKLTPIVLRLENAIAIVRTGDID